MMRNYIYLLILTLISCGSQKTLIRMSDQMMKDHLRTKNIIIINEPSDQGLLTAIKDKYEYYKDYNTSPIYLTVGDTLKRIFSEKNLASFQEQLNKQIPWSEKPYVKQTIIDKKDRNKYREEIIFSFSHPVITRDKKYALMQSSSYHQLYMVGSNELLIFKKQKNKWVVYKRFELFSH